MSLNDAIKVTTIIPHIGFFTAILYEQPPLVISVVSLLWTILHIAVMTHGVSIAITVSKLPSHSIEEMIGIRKALVVLLSIVTLAYIGYRILYVYGERDTGVILRTALALGYVLLPATNRLVAKLPRLK